jgi:hypothetical protein
MHKLLIAVIVAFVLFAIISYSKLTEQLRIYRGVGVINDADEQPIAAGIISTSIIPDPLAPRYWDGKQYKSCELCPNGIICPHCPQYAATEAFDSAESAVRPGAMRRPGHPRAFSNCDITLDEVNNCRLAANKSTRINSGLLADNDINSILYGEVMGLDYLAGPAPDDHVIMGLQGYEYKERRPELYPGSYNDPRHDPYAKYPMLCQQGTGDPVAYAPGICNPIHDIVDVV